MDYEMFVLTPSFLSTTTTTTTGVRADDPGQVPVGDGGPDHVRIPPERQAESEEGGGRWRRGERILLLVKVDQYQKRR